jgi:hypothetical protein
MTKRERNLVLATFGVIEGVISFVGVGDLLINGRIYPALLLVFVLVVLASTPFAVPSLWESLNSHKLTNKPDDLGKNPN